MTEQQASNETENERKDIRLSIIWLVPLVAALAAAWLFWQSYNSWGPSITITFETADGLEAGKTQIKYRDVALGVVKSISPSSDFSHVVVKAEMTKGVDSRLTTGTRFWIVKPRLSVEGISGLGTLVSGAYIEMDPGQGDEEDNFTGLETPPVILTNQAGKSFILHATQLGSIEQGSPLYFHGIKVGDVLGYDLSDKDGSIAIRVFIQAPHDQLVHENTRFWNASGVNFDFGSDGLKIQTPSLAALFVGGITFDVPANQEPKDVAVQNTDFTLFNNSNEANDSIYTEKIHFTLNFNGTVDGVEPGTDVRMGGMKIGQVSDVHIEYDPDQDVMDMPVTIELEPERIRLTSHDHSKSLPKAQTKSTDDFYHMFSHLVDHGMRAQIGSSNLLTGQKVINLNFVPDAKAEKMLASDPYPEIPTLDSDDPNTLLHTAKTLMQDMDETVLDLNKTLVSPELQHSLKNLDKTINNLQGITHDASVNIGPLLKSLRGVAAATDQALSNEGDGNGDLAGTFRELKSAASSMRALADYLEHHPESLLRGKAPDHGEQ